MSLVGFTLLGPIEAPTLTGTATGVPLLVKPNTEFTAAMLLNLDVGGGDLRFSSDAAGLNQLPCEIVDGLDVVWVKPTGVSISTGATLYVWGDNTGAVQPAVGDAFGRNAVWSDYEAVIHANEVGTNGVFADSTGNGYDTTLTTGTLSTTTTDNPFGLAWPDFDTSQVVKLTSSYAMLNNTAYSVSMWWNADVSENFIGLFGSRYKSPSDSNNIQITSDGRPSNNPSGFINVSQSANVTRLLKIKCDSASLQLMTNGVQLGIDTTVSIATNNTQVTQDFRIGTYYDDGAIRRYNGNVGEIRVKKFKDVDAFDLIEYDNQSTTGSWWIASDVGGGGLVISPISIATAEAFGNPVVATGLISLSPSTISSLEFVGIPTISTGGSFITPVPIVSEELVGSPVVLPLGVSIQPVVIASQEVVGTPTVVTGLRVVFPTGIPSEEFVGLPAIDLILKQIFPTSILTAEDVGRPSVLGGDVLIIPIPNRATWNAVAAYLRTVSITFSGDDNDVICAWLRSEGLEDQYNDMWREYFTGSGYLYDNLADQYAKWKRGERGEGL